jgi:hypothetical protein
MTYSPRLGPFIPALGSFDTLANLTSTYAASTQISGIAAFTADYGWVWSDGTSWRAMALGGVNSFQFITSGASATVSAGVQTVILNGVNTTFALTFPVPVGEGQVLEVNAAAAVSVAFSTVATAPATTIKTTPGTLAAGVGVAWIYHVADTSWYRLY